MAARGRGGRGGLHMVLPAVSISGRWVGEWWLGSVDTSRLVGDLDPVRSTEYCVALMRCVSFYRCDAECEGLVWVGSDETVLERAWEAGAGGCWEYTEANKLFLARVFSYCGTVRENKIWTMGMDSAHR